MNPAGSARLDRLRLYYAAFAQDVAAGCYSLGVQFVAVNAGLPLDVVGYVAIAGSFCYTLSAFFLGRLSDRLGRKPVAVTSLVIVCAAYYLMALAGRLTLIVPLAMLAAGTIATFWPGIQAWLSEVTETGASHLGRTMSSFNVAWSAGLMLGPYLAGKVYLRHPDQPFLLASLASGTCVLALLFMRSPRDPAPAEPPRDSSLAPPAPSRADLYLRMAWYANFVSWSVGAVVRALFPKLGKELTYSEDLIGQLIAAFGLAQMTSFALLRWTTRWQYRTWPLLVAQLAAIAGLLLALVAQRPALFALAFFLPGLCAGVTYSASLFYSLHDRAAGRAQKSGVHEAVLGSGVLVGPLLGGWAGRLLEPRAMFAVPLLMIAISLFLQWRVLARLRTFKSEPAP